MSKEREKQLAAEAVVEMVEDGATVGLGTGSTALYALKRLGRRVREEGLRVRCVPTSHWTRQIALEEQIPLTSLDEVDQLDLTMDGADEVDSALNLIKGGGGALFREKIVAAASRRLIIFVDRAKLVQHLGAFPLPVEVNPFGWSLAARRIESLGAQVSLRIIGYSPLITENGGVILDCAFGRIDDPQALQKALREVTGVMETGLFLGMAEQVVVAEGGQIKHLYAKN